MVSHPQKGMELELISMGGNTVDYIHMHKYSSACECVNKMSYIHTTAFHSALKKNEIMIYATTWMNPENTMLNELIQTQRTNII